MGISPSVSLQYSFQKSISGFCLWWVHISGVMHCRIEDQTLLTLVVLFFLKVMGGEMCFRYRAVRHFAGSLLGFYS